MKLQLFIISVFFCCVQCAKILGVFPAPGYSQYILAEVLMKEIANRGHEVTVISPYTPKNEPPNYKTIKTDDVIESIADLDLFQYENANLFKNIMATYELGNAITEYTMKNRNVQDLLQSNENFDLVIVEQFFNDAMKAFATHFKAPLVLFSSMGLTEWNRHYMGNPMLPSINAVCYTNYTNHMRFFQRIRNLAGTVFDYCYRNLIYYPKQKEYLKRYFPENINFNEIINNASLMLMNSHMTTSENSLLTYNMIEIGGFHVINDSLSKDVKDFLDGATNGAILFSMGSNLRSSDLSKETLDVIFKVFGKLKQKVLWKFEADLPHKPKNVLIYKWLKQSDVLAHPNLRLFITHGGMLSTTEAIFYGVPMVGIPIFADQKMNMARASSMGIANVIPFKTLSEETLLSAINDAINNQRFHENVERASSLMRDRAVKPLDLAIYWIEYAIRHKGFRLDTPVLHLYWFEVYMLDILGFFLFFIVTLFLLTKCACKLLRKATCINVSRVTKNRKGVKKDQ